MASQSFKFRTEVTIEKSPFSISTKSKIFLAGSCFADVIGGKLKSNKIDVLVNPYGNIYNPTSLFSLLQKAIDKTHFSDSSFIEIEGRWFNFDFHSEVSDSSKEGLCKRILDISERVGNFLAKTEFLILTLGTSYVYRQVSDNSIVANCHKVPARNFRKELLSPKIIIDAFEELKKHLKPDIKIIFTVSPVRHIKDTLPLNNVSKSILRTAVHYICETFDNTYYFPAYEILIDDLRDYRFYKDDMIHPTELTEAYIWDKFTEAHFDSNALSFFEDCKKINKAINHKPFHPESVKHQRFLSDTLRKVEELNKVADFTSEIEILKKQLLVSSNSK